MTILWGHYLIFTKLVSTEADDQEPVSQYRKHKLKFKATKWTTMVEMPEVMHVSILFFTGKEGGEERGERGRRWGKGRNVVPYIYGNYLWNFIY